jgi:predicted transcriptional regulator
MEKRKMSTELRKLREAAGIPQIKLAEQANVSRFRLYKAECGWLELTHDERERVNQVLNPAIAAAAQAIGECMMKQDRQTVSA